jgi:hypothetical protein
MSNIDCENFLLVALRIKDYVSSLPSANTKGQPITGDFIYETTRLAALVYCRAIVDYLPFSKACRPEELHAVYAAMSQIPLSQWKRFPGVWLFALLSINPVARNLPIGVTLRSLLKISCFTLGSWEWQIYVNVMESFIYVQKWIRGAHADLAQGIRESSAQLGRGERQLYFQDSGRRCYGGLSVCRNG